MLWNRTYTATGTVSSALNSTQGGFLFLGAVTETPDSQKSHIWLWQTNAIGEIQKQSELLEINPYMFIGLSRLAPSHDGGAVFTGSFFYERSNENSVSTSAADKFWIAKVSVSGHGETTGESGFPVSEVAFVAGIAVAGVLAVLVVRKHKSGKKGHKE